VRTFGLQQTYSDLEAGFQVGVPVSVVVVPAQSTTDPPFGSPSIANCCGTVVRVEQQQQAA
jgi:hypothetical protein